MDVSLYEVISNHEVRLIPDYNNPITTPFNYIDDFWVSFIPEFNDVEFESYKFTYDPTLDIKDTIDVENWEVRGSSDSYVLPNVNAPYFMNDRDSTPSNYVCHATQIATYLEMGNSLSFNITGELNSFGSGDLINGILSKEYLSLYINTKIQNYESLEKLIIHLQDSNRNNITLDQVITLEELIMYDFDIKIDLTEVDTNLKYIEIEPIFRDDAELSYDNTVGIARYEFAEWNDDMVFNNANGDRVMNFTLDNVLLTNSTDLDLAYLYNEYLEYLEIPDEAEISWGTTKDILGNIDSYILQIPNTYKNPDNKSEILTFEDGDLILVRYNSPVKKGIGIGIGKMYFEKVPYNYNPSIPIAECLLINASDSTDYSQFMEPYAFQIPLRLTPFDTEYSNTFKAIGINISLFDLRTFAVDGMLDFTDIIFSVPDPSYELTIDQIKIVRIGQEPTEEYETLYERIWQYSELEIYTSGDNCTIDVYEWEDVVGPLFYGDSKWLDHLMIYDDNYNYYSAGTGEDEHQLIWSSMYENFTWNPAFDRFQDYWGMEIELPMMVENNTKLYFPYCTNNSWKTPIGLYFDSIDLGSLEVIFDDSYYMTPKYEEWFGKTVENSVFDYEFIQYYDESFTIYGEVEEYIYQFETEYSFESDFNNTQVFKIVGIDPTFNETDIKDGADFGVVFNPASNEIIITDKNWNPIEEEGILNDFDLITAILNFSFGPVSSYSEIILSNSFNETYLSDIENSFFDYLTISFSYYETSGDILFEEGWLNIFESIDYTRNPTTGGSNNILDGYDGSTLFINYEEYQDDFNIIFEADLEMDGIKDYKQIIDVDKDGITDITKFGIEDEENPSDIIWHTVIQNIEYEEVIKEIKSEPIKRTKWFDIKDSIFSTYEFSLTTEYDESGYLSDSDLLTQIFSNVVALFMPDMDFWAQKSITRESTEIQNIESRYYSLRLDVDRDGYAEKEICYERNEVTTYINVADKETTIIAARPQDIFNYLWEYAQRSWDTFFNGPQEDFVFNDKLTEDKLDRAHEGTLIYLLAEPVTNPELVINQLKATYNKFTKTTATTYIDNYIVEEITFTDWNEGEIVETRIYSDDFDNNEIDTGITSIYTITDITTGQQVTISGDSSQFITEPVSAALDIETWSEDNVLVIFDSKTTINELRVDNENYFEKIITLRIPNRFSLYYDIYKTSDPTDEGSVEFTVSGMFITPPDGMVYYMSDKELFKSGNAKTQGHYFYYDSDENGFYETVYVLAFNQDKDIYETYDVIAIGYNYDGKHDFAPYERVYIHDQDIDDTDFSSLMREPPRKYAQNWMYNFSKFENYELLSPKDDYDGLEPKDHIFEISKLTKTYYRSNTELFNEVRERIYEDAWEIYREQMWTDVFDQVFMMVTSTAVSAPFKAIPYVGEALSIAVYIGVYSLLTKFNIDFKMHEAESKQRSITFLPEGGEMQPTKLNDRTFVDNVLLLGDTMPAALMGHPGAYYTTIMGGEIGNMYTAEAIVSPPNILRSFTSLTDALFGSLAYAFTLSPDAMFQMDFDNINLEYELVMNELYSYNNRPYYSYGSFEAQDWLYDQYRNNTIGYLEQKIKEKTNNKLNTIKPIIIDGRPEYIFVDGDSDINQKTLPEFYINHPIIVSPSSYTNLVSTDASMVSGNLFVDVKCSLATDTKGLDSRNLQDLERKLGYKSKIPLSEGVFNYPLNFVTIEVIKEIKVEVDGDVSYIEKLLTTVRVPTSYYTIDNGDLYFTKNLEDVIFGGRQKFDSVIGSSPYHSIFYRVRINFARIIPDSGSDGDQRIGLAQSTSYAIRDFFNQYTFACTSAQMISEVGYTEIMTLISTSISVPFIIFGQWAVSGLTQAAQEGSKLTVKAALKQLFSRAILKEIAKAPVKEAFEEIVIDGFIEGFFGNLVSMTTGNEDLSFWVTSLMTSVRESGSGPGRGGMQFDYDSAMYYSSDFRKQYSQAWALAERAGMDEETFREQFKSRMEEIYGVQQG